MVEARTTVTVEPNGQPRIDVDITNQGEQRNDLYVGVTVKEPSGTRVNIRPKEVEVNPGETKTVTFTNTFKGSLSPADGGPEAGRVIFNNPGDYNIITQVYNKWNTDADPQRFSFGIALNEPLTEKLEIDDAIKLEEPIDQPPPGDQPPQDTLIPDIPEEIIGIGVPDAIRDTFNGLDDTGRAAAIAVPVLGLTAIDDEQEGKILKLESGNK